MLKHYRDKCRGAAVWLMVLAAMTAACLWRQSFPVAAAAEVHAAGNTTAVNLKDGNWVYSTYLDKDGTPYAAVTGYNDTALTLDIPASLGGIPVRSVSREAFAGNIYVTEVTLADGITDIGKYSFQGCVGLQKLTLPSTLKSIGDGAFYGCDSLTELTLPDTVNKIGDSAFFRCRHLRSVQLSDALQSIGDDAFAECIALETVTFGDQLESIGNRAFQNNTALLCAELPTSLVSLGRSAFVNCASLTEVNIGDNVEEVRPETFRGCSALRDVTLGESIRTVGASAFEGCESLKTLTLGDLTEYIGALAFYRCAGLEEIRLGGALHEIGFGALDGCAALRTISVAEENETFRTADGCLYSARENKLLLCPQGIANSVAVAENTETIDDYAFAGCRWLRHIHFADSVSTIGTAAFLSCTDMTSLSLPSAIGKIGCLSLGYYMQDKELKKASYLEVFGEQESTADLYCAAHDVRFRPYNQSMVLNTEKVVMGEGSVFTLQFAFLSDKKSKIAWESSDPLVVQVSGGKLTGVAAGHAEVTVSAEGFDTLTVPVTVTAKEKRSEKSRRTGSAADEKTIDNTHQLYRGETEELSSLLNQIIDPLLAPDKCWFSSKPAIATVSADGRVTAQNKGNATITCREPDGSTSLFLITVTEQPTSFRLSAPAQEIPLGESLTIGRAMLPSHAAETVVWKSENPAVAAVDENGTVTAISQGNCEIQATTAGGLKDTVTVKCILPAQSLSLNLESRSVYQSKEFNLEATLSPDDSKETIRWRSSDPTVVSVNSKGKVKGVSFGTATVYAETDSGAQASCTVNVVAKAKVLRLETKSLQLNVGNRQPLHAVILPSYSPESTERCTWNSTDEKVAAVDEDGNVTAVGVGNCIINCKIGDLISKCRVTVKQPAQTAEIICETPSVYIGETTVLRVKLTPEGATDKIVWQSDHEEIAKVTSQGAVKGVAAGKAVITAIITNEISGESLTASCEIQVLKPADTIKLKRDTLSLHTGDSDSLLYFISPNDSNDTVYWTSSDESVAAVREDGLVTAVGAGTCTVTVKTGSGCTARCKIVVD